MVRDEGGRPFTALETFLSNSAPPVRYSHGIDGRPIEAVRLSNLSFVIRFDIAERPA
jgi:hypothetical protein